MTNIYIISRGFDNSFDSFLRPSSDLTVVVSVCMFVSLMSDKLHEEPVPGVKTNMSILELPKQAGPVS